MPQRNSKKQDQNATVLRRSPRFVVNSTMIQAEPTSVLRRSSRLLAKTRVESDPKTPIHGRKGTMGSLFDTNSCISTPKECVKVSKPRNSVAGNVLKESNFAKENEGFGRSEELGVGSSGLRRSSRLSGKENVNSRSRLNFDEFSKEDKDFGKKGMRGKKIKVKANLFGKGGLSNQPSGNVVIGLAAQSVGETNKTSNSNPGNARKLGKKCVGNVIDGAEKDSEAKVLDKGASSSVERISKSGLGPSDQETVAAASKAPVKVRAERVARAVMEKRKCIGVKRKRNQVEDGCEKHGTISGWTAEQEDALQKAYYAVNITPRFWKDVAKMVPGKSAQDCFNRIHADQLTPRQAKPRSRARLPNSSPILYSASKLLDSIRPKSKRPGHTKRKSHLVKKTTRQLLQKQCQVNRDQNADIFSLLEPEISLSSNALRQGVNCSTPKQGESILLRRCQEPSSSARRMQCSRFNNGTSLESPPVLKPIKNKALHEKYIDQLHAREAKRRAVAARVAKSNVKLLDGKECHVRKNAVESAKNALLLDARDAINQFQHEQASDLSSFPDDGDVLYRDEDLNEALAANYPHPVPSCSGARADIVRFTG